MIESNEKLTGSVKASQTLKGNIKSGGSSNYELPIASKDVLGGIKVGENLTIDEDGTLNATGGSGEDVSSEKNEMMTVQLTKEFQHEASSAWVRYAIPFDDIASQIGDSFSLTPEGRIKVGKGVSKVSIYASGLVRRTNTIGQSDIAVRVFRNNESVWFSSSYLYIPVKKVYISVSNFSSLVEVQENDEIELSYTTESIDEFRYSIIGTFLTVQKINDNNVLMVGDGETVNLNEYTKKNEFKTINGQSLLGEGDIEISGGSGTGDVTKDEIYYKKGDVFTTAYPITICGLVTSGTKGIIFCFTTPKRLDNIKKITCTSLMAELRGTNGYLNNASGYKEYATDSDYTIVCNKVNGNTIEVHLDKSSAYTNINNNTLVAVRSYLEFEFE